MPQARYAHQVVDLARWDGCMACSWRWIARVSSNFRVSTLLRWIRVIPRRTSFGHREGNPVRYGALEQAADPLVTSHKPDERAGVQCQAAAWWDHVISARRRMVAPVAPIRQVAWKWKTSCLIGRPDDVAFGEGGAVS
jgi:hypothetical protein